MRKISIYPKYPLEEAMIFAEKILYENGGNPMRRLTIFDKLQRSPTSSTSRLLISASSTYGLTKGSYNAEKLSITETGIKVIQNNPDAIMDSIFGINIFKNFFEKYTNSIFPSHEAVVDFLKENGIENIQNAEECLEIIKANGKYAKLIQNLSGLDRIVTRASAIESFQAVEQQLPQIPDRPISDPNKNNPEFSHQPSLHIDIQIHIDANAKPEQIDQVFKSMEKYLWKSEK